MPITITPTSPGGIWGPGLPLKVQTDLIGPLPSTTVWTIAWQQQNSEEPTFQVGWNNNSNPVTFVWGTQPRDNSWTQTNRGIQDGAVVTINATVQESGGGPANDSGTGQATWSTDAGLGNLILETGGSTGGGLTPTQSTQLEQTHDSTWPQFLVDNLTLQSVTNGPTGNPVAANLTAPVFGVIVRIANVPADLLPQTPDGNYWIPALAVVRIFRGADLWLRIPIHTSSKIINLWVEGLALGLADAVLNAGWLLNLTLQAWFREGVTGEIFLMRVP